MDMTVTAAAYKPCPAATAAPCVPARRMDARHNCHAPTARTIATAVSSYLLKPGKLYWGTTHASAPVLANIPALREVGLSISTADP